MLMATRQRSSRSFLDEPVYLYVFTFNMHVYKYDRMEDQGYLNVL